MTIDGGGAMNGAREQAGDWHAGRRKREPEAMTVERSDSINELATALAKAQAEIGPAPKESVNPAYKSHYANLTAVWESCRIPLTANGLSVVQSPEADGSGVMVLRTTLMHASGQWLSGSLPLAFDPGKMQSLGSAITYARRYALSAMLGIVSEEDDDGHAAARPERRDAEPEAPAQRRSDWNTAYGGDKPAERKYDDRPPTTGKALFAWTRAMEEKHQVGLLKWLSSWGKLQEFPDKMVTWDGEQVALAHKEATRKLQASGQHGDAYEEALAN